MSAEAFTPQIPSEMTDSSGKEYDIKEGKGVPTGFYEVSEEMPVEPSEIRANTHGEYVASFGHAEKEAAASYLVRICQGEGRWVGITSTKLDESANADIKDLKKGKGKPDRLVSGLSISLVPGLKELADEGFIKVRKIDGVDVFFPTKKMVEYIVEYQKSAT